MTKTAISHTSSYCTAAQMILRWDVRTLGDLLSVDGERLTSSEVAADTKLAAWLKESSGEFEGAIFRGGKYTLADIAALAGTNGAEMVAGLIADLTMWRVYDFRPDRKSEMPQRCKDAKERIKAIEHGEEILPFQESADASRLDHQTVTTQEVELRNGMTFQADRYFGRRADRSNPING